MVSDLFLLQQENVIIIKINMSVTTMMPKMGGAIIAILMSLELEVGSVSAMVVVMLIVEVALEIKCVVLPVLVVLGLIEVIKAVAA